MSLLEELQKQFPELAVSFKGDDMLLRVKDINEYDRVFTIGGIDDVVLHFLMPPDQSLKARVEAYVRQIRTGVKRVIFCY